MTRDDSEYNKFGLSQEWDVLIITVEGESPATAILSWNRDELEKKKFTSNWSLRVITTF